MQFLFCFVIGMGTNILFDTLQQTVFVLLCIYFEWISLFPDLLL